MKQLHENLIKYQKNLYKSLGSYYKMLGREVIVIRADKKAKDESTLYASAYGTQNSPVSKYSPTVEHKFDFILPSTNELYNVYNDSSTEFIIYHNENILEIGDVVKINVGDGVIYEYRVVEHAQTWKGILYGWKLVSLYISEDTAERY